MTPRLRRGARAALLVLALATVGAGSACGGGNGSSDAEISVPDVTIVAYNNQDVFGGEEVSLHRLIERTDKPIVLNFWAGLCPPCRAEMPHFQEVYDERADDFLLVGIDIGPFMLLGTREDGQALLDELGITYPSGTTFEEMVVRDFEVLGMPTTIFLTPDGAVHRSFSGLLNKEKFIDLLEEVL